MGAKMRLAAGAPANSAIAERKPDRAFGFSGRGCGGFEPAGAEEQHPSHQRSQGTLRELHQAPVKARAQIVEFYALQTSDDLRV
jgi:hypothetical protein